MSKWGSGRLKGRLVRGRDDKQVGNWVVEEQIAFHAPVRSDARLLAAFKIINEVKMTDAEQVVPGTGRRASGELIGW